MLRGGEFQSAFVLSWPSVFESKEIMFCHNKDVYIKKRERGQARLPLQLDSIILVPN